MERYIFDEDNRLWYELKGDYYIPCLTLPKTEQKEIGIWGMRHLEFLKLHRKSAYNRLTIEGKLNSYLYDINAEAKELFDILIKQFKKSEGITEQLKAQDQMLWVSKMNNIQHIATEIVNNELIYRGAIKAVENNNFSTAFIKHHIKCVDGDNLDIFLKICIETTAKQLGISTDEVRKEFITVLQKFCNLTEEEISSITNILSVFFSPLLAFYYEEYIHILQVKTKLFINKTMS